MQLFVAMPFILRDCGSPISLLLFVGKTEFSADEDAHVIGDCVKVLVSLAAARDF